MQEIEQSRLEMGGDLFNLAQFAKKWFVDNNVQMPSSSSAWQKATIKRKEIPPKCNFAALRRLGITPRLFIQLIKGEEVEQEKYKQNVLTKENIENLLGLLWITEACTDGVHKSVYTKCTKCGFYEYLDKGTLTRMLARGDKYCRLCRNVGGKEKPLNMFNKFEGFSIVDRTNDSRFIYRCNTCESLIERTSAHVLTSEYLVCEVCNPRVISGARLTLPEGTFHSKIEYLAYLKLKEILPESFTIERQVSYNKLFNTGTKHTADFFIPELDLVLEITTKSNNLSQKYLDTAKWKCKISTKVKFAYSVREVEDIVRPLVKAKGLTVAYCRSLLCRRFVRRPKASRSV